jgi:hypothetical protein
MPIALLASVSLVNVLVILGILALIIFIVGYARRP